MLDPDGLNVWSNQQLVGYLWRNTQGLIGFRYEDEWLAESIGLPAINLTLRSVANTQYALIRRYERHDLDRLQT